MVNLIGISCWTLPLMGCGPQTIQPSVERAVQDSSAQLDWTDLGLLFYRIVDGDNINTAKLLDNRFLLERFLVTAAKVGPNLTPQHFPNKDTRLAYLINCHNATLLRCLIAAGDGNAIPQRLPVNLDRRFRFLIDGRVRSPADLRREILDLATGDWRVRLALYSGLRVGPPLRRRVFLPEMLDAQLDEVTRATLKSPHVVRIDHGEQRRLLLWRGLYDIRREMIDDYAHRYHTTGATVLSVLLEWSDRFRRETLNSAVGYTVAPMDSDNRVNAIATPPVK